MPLSAFVTTV